MCHRNIKVVLARVMTSSASLSFIHFYVSINIKSKNFWLANFTVRLNCWMIQSKEDAFTFYFYVNKLRTIVFPFYFFFPLVANELICWYLDQRFKFPSGKYLGYKSSCELINLCEVVWFVSDGVRGWPPWRRLWHRDLNIRRLLGNTLGFKTWGEREVNRIGQREKVTLIKLRKGLSWPRG